MESMAERLKSLGFKNAVSISQKAVAHQTSLEDALAARVVQNSLGEFVIKDVIYPLNYQHGIVSLTNQVVTDTIRRAGKIDSNTSSLDKLLFIDTETTGLSGGAGNFAFMVGYGRFTIEGFLLSQLIIRDPGEEPAMLLHLMNSIDDDTIFVSFNGKSFDIPLLQNRLIINRLPKKLREHQHLDMLHISRKLWRRSLDSCALKDLETAIIKFERTSEDVPGWMIPDIYFAFLRTGEPSGLKEVVYHNSQDILSLAALFIHVTNMLETNISIDNIAVNDLIAIGRIYWDLGSLETSVKIFQSILPRLRDGEQKVLVNSMLARYYKRVGILDKSIGHWQAAGQMGDISACIELAMYYEHKIKDYSQASHWCEKALEIYYTGVNNISQPRQLLSLRKRLVRLQQKRRKDVQKNHS